MKDHEKTVAELLLEIERLKSRLAVAEGQLRVFREETPGADVERRELLNRLGERVKELTALYSTARVLQASEASPTQWLEELVALLPPAFQYPEVAAARIVLGGLAVATPEFADCAADTPDNLDRLRADFRTVGGTTGSVEVVYCEPQPTANEGAFLAEERELLNLITDMICQAIEKRELEQARRHSEAQLARAQQIAHLGSWDYDLRADELHWSDEVFRINGISPQGFAASQEICQRFIHPDDVEMVMRAMEDALEGRQPFDFDHRILRPDGSVRYVHAQAEVARDEAGRAVRIFGTVQDITERKEAEERLRESEERYRELFENANDIIYTLDLEGRVTSVNRVGERILGYQRDEILGRSIGELVTPESLKQMQEALARKTAGEAQTNYELEITAKTGGKIMLEVSSRLVYDGDQPTGIQGIARDISGRKQAAERLERLNRALTVLSQINQALIHSTDEQTLLNDICRIIVQEGEYRLAWVGFVEPPAEAAEPPRLRAIAQVFSGGYVEGGFGICVEAISTPAAAAVRLGKPQIAHYRAGDAAAPAWHADAARDGITSALALPLMDNGRAFGAVCICAAEESAFGEEERSLLAELADDLAFGVKTLREREERRRAEDALHRSEETRRVVLQNAPVAVFAFDSKGIINLSEGKVLETLGYSPNETVGQSVFDLHRDNPPVLDAVRRALAGESFSITYEVNRRLLEVWFSPFHSKDGEMTGVIGVALDISERAQAEASLHAKEEQLRQAQRMESIGRLAGGVAHDFNNLLTAINGYSDLTLMQLRPSDPLRRNVVEIKKAGERAASLTRQLLAFSRKQMLQPQVLNLNHTVTDISRMLHRLLGEDIEVSTLLARDLGQVSADPGQLEQVIVNLAVNARDAMPEGGKLLIETANVLLDDRYAEIHAISPGAFVRLAITDTGTGMDRETQERIFEPFFTTKEVGKGTGLGLATVYGIVTQSGGSIQVYSEVGSGTTFKVYLPRVDAAAGQPTAATAADERQRHGSETILLVEDDEMVRTITYTTLKMYGYNVLEAVNGGEALLICQQHAAAIHLLLTDVVMPRMSGREVARQLLALRPEMRVLYMSGYTENAIIQHGALEDDIEFLEKPFTPGALIGKVRDVLDRRHGAG